jgi:hypothetical protein
MRQTLDFMESFVVVGLVMAGLAGLSYHLLRDEGWLEMVFGSVWDFSIRYPLIAVPLVAGALVLGKMWRDDRVAHGKHSSKGGAAALYLIVAAGIYFVGHFLIKGTL